MKTSSTESTQDKVTDAIQEHLHVLKKDCELSALNQDKVIKEIHEQLNLFNKESELTVLTQEKVNKMLQEHLHWLNRDCEDWHTKRADFSNCKLECIIFSHQNCEYVSFDNAVIKNCYFNKTVLIDATFRDAYITHSDFSNAMLINASFCRATILCALFKSSMLHHTNFSHAVCECVDFQYSSCIAAHFIQSSMITTDFEYANLQKARFDETEYVRFGQVLKEPLIGYKKTREDVIITAEIPAGAIVFSINNYKCRTNKAKIIDMNGYEMLHSYYDYSFQYKLGQIIEIDNFNTVYNVECGAGFHFFKNKADAEAYNG